MKKQITLFSVCALTAAQTTFAGTLPTEHAPIGVMGDHNHLKGEWMVAYRYMNMKMENKLINSNDIFNGAMMAPRTMKKEMHMFGMMYGITNQLTIVGSVPIVKTQMSMSRTMGDDFDTRATGIGDIKIGALYTLFQEEHSKIIANVAISFPTGSINQTDTTPMMAAQLLSPNMQPGSGSFGVITKVTYTDRSGNWAWGGQIGGNFPLETNDNSYKYGSRGALTAWVARDLYDFVSVSLRVDGQKWADITLNGVRAMDLYGGERVDLLAGINFIIPEGVLKGNRFAIEFGKPIHQDTTGNRMENKYRLHAGWQLAF